MTTKDWETRWVRIKGVINTDGAKLTLLVLRHAITKALNLND